MKSEYFAGVSEPNPGRGLTNLEIEEIVFEIARDARTRVICLSEYNPAIEKF